MSRIVNVLSGAYNSIFQPSELVGVNKNYRQSGLRGRLGQLQNLTVIYIINLILYAIPLTLAGFGRQSVPEVPAWFGSIAVMGDTQSLWSLTYSFFQNSLSILGATVLTLATFHIGVKLTRQSKGLLETSYAVIYSTSVYLAGIFSVVWYLSLQDGVNAARTYVANLQRAFVYAVIDFFGADLGLPGGRPDGIDLSGVSGEGGLLISILAVLIIYYLYSLYLGARINHESPRTYSLLAVGFVASSPIIYVSALVIAYSTPLITQI